MDDEAGGSHPAQNRGTAAARLSEASLEALVHDYSPEVLAAVASDARLTEDLALGLLARRDLPQPVLEELSKNATVMKGRKVLVALVSHPRTPRHIALPMARHLFTFELMSLALMPQVAADLKIAMEEAIITRLKTIAAGERLALAKRASTRVAGALLADSDKRVIEAALHNPHVTEAWIVKAVLAADAPPGLIEAICRMEKWSVRREVRMALLRNEHTPLARAIAFAQSLPANVVRDLLHHSRLPANVKTCLLAQMERRRV